MLKALTKKITTGFSFPTDTAHFDEEKRARFYTQIFGEKAARLKKKKEKLPLDELLKAGDDEIDFNIVGYYHDPVLGLFKQVDRRRASTPYEKKMVLSMDSRYKRVTIVGQTRRVHRFPPRGEKHPQTFVKPMKGAQWMFDELRRRAEAAVAAALKEAERE